MFIGKFRYSGLKFFNSLPILSIMSTIDIKAEIDEVIDEINKTMINLFFDTGRILSKEINA
ncbi:hypothetical protein GCM10011350_21280 [Marinomonas arctica]|nr:hypothetical protein GCM10011350_21280 [Marinomonas arctica]